MVWTVSYTLGRMLYRGTTSYIVTFGIGVIPLIKLLKKEHPDANQTWYDDDAGELGT